jgi:carbon storage regulator
MLVLSRKPSQTIVIDGQVVIRINQIRGNQVAIGIEAPDDIRILRGELQDAQESPAQQGPQQQSIVTKRQREVKETCQRFRY